MSPKPTFWKFFSPLALGALCLTPTADGALQGQEPSGPDVEELVGVPDIPDSRSRTARATRLVGSIEIDGYLDEEAWSRAELITGFIQVEPFEGEPAMESTEVRLLYDEENLYIGARMYDSDPSRIARQLTQRNQTGRAAGYFEFSFDSNMDRSSGYTFRVTAAGVQSDRYNYDDTSSDQSWDAIWESAVSIDDQGWVAEVRLPLSQLRFNPGPGGQVWGVNFARRRIADNERTEWAWVPSGVHGSVSRWGRLEGMTLTQQRRTAELLPYVLGGADVADAVPGDPFFDGTDVQGGIGTDIRYGLGSTFVLDMAVNPDFGQVQVDPQVVNLSAFETFFPERRSFFTRDDRLFDFSLSGMRNNLFHSRRIGRSPQGGSPGGADFTHVPRESTILGAAKVTGRTTGGLSLGILAAVTDRERGRAHFASENETVRFDVEPRTTYTTLRAQQDLREGESRVGAIFTGVDRSLPANGSLNQLPERAFSTGIDFDHSWADREWAIWGFLAGSHVTGSEEAIHALQLAPNHRFQRPDQDYLTLDPTATSMSGAEWRLQFERRSGRHWTGAIWAAQRTPGFEVNDIGFSTATERFDGGARIRYQQPDPGDVFQSYNFTVFTFQNWRHEVQDDVFSASAWGDAHKAGRVQANSSFTFLNWWGTGLSVGFRPEVLSDGLTRGGPLMVDPGAWDVSFRLNTDQRDDLTYSTSVDYAREGRGGGTEFGVDFSIDARPTERLAISLEPAYVRTIDPRQYVMTIDPPQYVTQFPNPGYEETYGGRYIFGDLRREEVSMNTSVDFIFSPNLSLQVFAQPLISAGKFTGLKQLAQPGTFDFIEFTEGEAVASQGGVTCTGGDFCRANDQIHLDYTGDGVADEEFREQNFNVRSLRGTAALRWEYRPGSRVYVIWQQRRQAENTFGDFDLSRDGRALFDAPGEHVFMIKVDYWLDL